MSPILGIWASAQQKAFVVTSSYDSIATVTVGSGGTSTVTFTSIPQTYTHLQLRVYTGTSTLNNSGAVYFNNDTTDANYGQHNVQGNGTSAASGYNGGAWLINFSGNSTYFSSSVIDILDYTNTNKFTTSRALNGYDANGSGGVDLVSTLWRNTAAISRIDIKTNSAATFVQYSSFALYGIKGA